MVNHCQGIRLPLAASFPKGKGHLIKSEGGSKVNNKGNLMSLPINLLMLFITITFLVALIPGFVEMQDLAQQSDNLNCVGYKYNGDANNAYSYNATIGTKSSIGCMAIKLYIPYIVLGVLIAGVALIFYGRAMGGDQQQTQY
jgi:hypothetical protein